MPRVVAGSAGGLRLDSPKQVGLRPTQDRIKQVIFSSLGDLVPGSSVLDLYAGTGSLGIEALSRGAARATFVEQDRSCVDCIQANLTKCHLAGSILQWEVLEYLNKAKSRTFQLIFADPPYEKIKSSLDAHPLLRAVRPWLESGGIFVWEHYSRQVIIDPEGWEVARHRDYGETGVTFLKRNT
jgi:16S rRNA (guanine966-N2)-methyltransferase